MGKKSRTKGALAEREIVNILKASGFHAERRAPMQANHDADDADVFSIEIGCIEVKRRKRGFSLLYQALENADLAVVRDDRGEWIAVQPLREYLLKGAK